MMPLLNLITSNNPKMDWCNTLSVSLVSDDPMVSVSTLQETIAIAVIAIAVRNLGFIVICVFY